MIVGHDAAKIYMFLEIHNWCKWFDCNMGKKLRIVHIPYRCNIEQPDTRQHNGMTNSETEMCMWKK